MKFLKQDIARRANAEDEKKGHFFEQRFWSAALLSERAILTIMAYIDLNPFRALIVKNIEAIRHAGITERLADLDAGLAALNDHLGPLVSGLGGGRSPRLITLGYYLELLRIVVDSETCWVEDSAESRWRKDVASIHRKQRAYGTAAELEAFARVRNWKRLGGQLGD